MKESLFRNLVLLLVVSSFMAAPAEAAVGTWNTNPANGDWHMPSNWSSMAVPNAPADVATFDLSSITSVFLSADAEVDSIVFNAGASAYTITSRPTHTLAVSGAGIVNNSGMSQNLVAGVDSGGSFGSIRFTHNAAIGSSISLISNGSAVLNRDGALIEFRDASSAGTGTLRVNGGATHAGNGGRIQFLDVSSAGQAALTSNGGGVVGGNRGIIGFYDNSTAAQATITNNGAIFGELADSFIGGLVIFRNNASAAQTVITNHGGTVDGAAGGGTGFGDNSTAGTALITNYGGAAEGAFGGLTGFGGNATAASSVIVSHGGAHPFTSGGITLFQANSTAAAATLIAHGGLENGLGGGGEISFSGDSSGGTASIEVFGNGFLIIRQHSAPGLTIGSLAGTGQVYLGGNNLSIGSNNLSTEFSGVMHDGDQFGPDPTGGSITKIGAGTFVLSGQNTNTGETIVNAGKLIISGSVLTPVIVNGGTLGGTGTMGATTINGGATLSPGDGLGVLHLAGDLILTLGATYLVEVNGATVGTGYDQTTVAGTVALDGATLSLSLGFQSTPGMMFTILDNDGTDVSNGTFDGLSEGATFAADGQTFSISYQGGSGNDVVLTVVVPEPTTWFLVAIGALLLGRCRRVRRRPF